MAASDAAPTQRQPKPDCLECRLIGTGSMLSLSGWFFYHARGIRTSRNPTHAYFKAALGLSFAAAGLARWLA